jgi:hypothetical protein
LIPDNRLADVVEAMTAAVRDVVKIHHITQEEWLAALRFLTEVGREDEFILLSDTMRLSVFIEELSRPDSTGATASSVLGPFWREAPLLANPATSPVTEAGSALAPTGRWLGDDAIGADEPSLGVIIEKLEGKDDQAHSYSYEITDGPLPVANYHACISVHQEGDEAVVEWESRFEPKGASLDEASKTIQGIYETGMEPEADVRRHERSSLAAAQAPPDLRIACGTP